MIPSPYLRASVVKNLFLTGKDPAHAHHSL